jgi:hypothetical protein
MTSKTNLATVVCFFLLAGLGFAQSTVTVNPVGVAQQEFVGALNALNSNAGALRTAMPANTNLNRSSDADLFDGIMMDVVGIAKAEGWVATARKQKKDVIVVAARYNRENQLVPDLNGLNNFLGRLAASSTSDDQRLLFTSAQRSVQKMLKQLPLILPTVTVPTSTLSLEQER